MKETMIELFSGSGVMSDTAETKGIYSLRVDYNEKLPIDLKIDMLDDKAVSDLIKNYKGSINYVWASPPCTTFSVASISTHWTGGRQAYVPKTQASRNGLKILENTIRIITELKPEYWYIENPRGVMRKVIDKLFKKHGVTGVIRHTVTYCQYGEDRMKPTDVWTNNPNWVSKPMCKNGAPCHVRAPRGAKTGTQGLKNNYERSKLPQDLCDEIVESMLK